MNIYHDDRVHCILLQDLLNDPAREIVKSQRIPLSKVKKNIDKVGLMLYYCGPDVNLNS